MAVVRILSSEGRMSGSLILRRGQRFFFYLKSGGGGRTVR